MKTLALLLLAAIAAPAALAGGNHAYQYGKVLSFDTGQRLSKHAPKGEVIYQVQIGTVIYKVTRHSKKAEFSAGEDVDCRVDKDRLILRKPKGGEMKYEILGESSRP
ncbi:MAG TPA: hypothetical protein VGR93_00140 [Candidatus Acidoferrales bacterium]|nr:hypothetical protein [Candidatus Acidoferrales bacterium]